MFEDGLDLHNFVKMAFLDKWKDEILYFYLEEEIKR